MLLLLLLLLLLLSKWPLGPRGCSGKAVCTVLAFHQPTITNTLLLQVVLLLLLLLLLTVPLRLESRMG